jgi:hypothetical protein
MGGSRIWKGVKKYLGVPLFEDYKDYELHFLKNVCPTKKAV